MSATANDLMTATASFMGRERSTFIRNGFDCLLQATNNARLYAERMVDFELSRVSVEVPNVSLTDGGSLDSAVLHSDHTTPVNVKKIKKAFITFPNNSNTFPVSFYSRDKWLRRVQRNWERLRPIDPAVFANKNVEWWSSDFFGSVQQFAVVQMARKVYLTPADERIFNSPNVTLYFDVLQWLPLYGKTTLIGSTTSTTASKLVASAAHFVTDGVHIGMVVRNTTTGAEAIVAAVESETSLLLNSNIFASGNAYSIPVAKESDFLLDACFDWLLYRSVWELNFMLKEDERVQLSQTLITDAWNALRCWNENLLLQSVDDSDLD